MFALQQNEALAQKSCHNLAHVSKEKGISFAIQVRRVPEKYFGGYN